MTLAASPMQLAGFNIYEENARTQTLRPIVILEVESILVLNKVFMNA
jgi:hypothetical protein